MVYLGLPTWTNHQGIFEGFDLRIFSHLKNGTVDTQAYMQAIEEAPDGAVFLIHV